MAQDALMVTIFTMPVIVIIPVPQSACFMLAIIKRSVQLQKINSER